jgi:hypothetical protein
MALEKVGACACVLRAVCWLKWAHWVAGLLLDLQGIEKCWRGCWRAARESLRPARPPGLRDRWTTGPGTFPAQGLSLQEAAGTGKVISP